jgi:hypothetical protein
VQQVQQLQYRNTPSFSPDTPSTGSGSSTSYGNQSKAGNVVSALAQFALASQRAQGARTEAQYQEMAARSEYTSAQEKANAIDAQFADIAGAQTVATAAAGLDVSSPSLAAWRAASRANADAEIRGARETAIMNASLRRAQAKALKASAGGGMLASGLAIAGDLMSAFNPAAGAG